MISWDFIVNYVINLWTEFISHVKHQEKKGQTGFLHIISTWLVAIHIGVILTILSVIVLVAAFLMMVPIAKLFGVDLSGLFARKQAKLQAKLKPGMVIPFVANFHSATQKWVSHNPAGEVFKDLAAAVKKQEAAGKNKAEKWEVIESDAKKMSITVHCFSKFKWLDVMELNAEVGEDMGGTVINATSYSTGAAPLILPPIFGVLSSLTLFWLPFSDFGANKKRLDDLRSTLHKEVKLESSLGRGKKDE